MKPASRLKKYYRKRINSVRFILSKSPTKVSSSDFHTLRVDIKKMRAMLVLIQFASGIKGKKYHKVYKKIFKQAGTVRDLQIEKAAVERIGITDSLENYLNDLEQRNNEEKEKWFLLTNKKKKIKKNFKFLLPYFKKVNNSLINLFIKSEQATGN